MNEAKKLAKSMFFILDAIEDEKLREWEEQELKEALSKIRREIYDKGYDFEQIREYMDEYKTLTIAEYYEWIKS